MQKAKAAREYLTATRHFGRDSKAFRIGYSPDKWDGLLNVLREKNIDEKLIEQSGLVSVNEEKERVFDRFRGRIMFPVFDVNGRPVAFGARALSPDDQPKYLNSPETAAYTKGENLYGLFQAKDEIRKKKFAILVEGYLDLIALVSVRRNKRRRKSRHGVYRPSSQSCSAALPRASSSITTAIRRA